MVDFLKIFNNHARFGQQYCRICYRTAEEARLVTPQHLFEFAKLFKLDLFPKHKILASFHACNICEAAAKTAMRLYNACSSALAVKDIFTGILSGKVYESEAALKGFTSSLRKYRNATTLQPTDVLVVHSLGVEWANQNEEGGNDTIYSNLKPNLQQAIHAISGSTSGTSVSAPKLPIWSPNLETVVLVDDDDSRDIQKQKYTKSRTRSKNSQSQNSSETQLKTYETSKPLKIQPALPELIPLTEILDNTNNGNFVAAIVPNQMQIIVKNGGQNKDLLMHPIVKGKRGELLIPTLSAQLKDEKLTFVENVYQNIVPSLVINNGTISQNTSVVNTVNIQNNIQLTQNDVDFIMRNDGQNVTTEASQGKCRTIQSDSSGSYVIENNIQMNNVNEEVDTILENALKGKMLEKRRSVETSASCKKLRNECLVDLETIVNMIGEVKEEPIAVISNVTGSLLPKRNNDRIDWEDKIPMDVISFMDAIDPATVPQDQAILPDQVPGSSQNMAIIPKIKQEVDPTIIDLC